MVSKNASAATGGAMELYKYYSKNTIFILVGEKV